MNSPKGSKEHLTPHHSAEQCLILHRPLATTVKGLSAIALPYEKHFLRSPLQYILVKVPCECITGNIPRPECYIFTSENGTLTGLLWPRF